MNADNSNILSDEINEKITIIEQEIEWANFHEYTFMDAVKTLKSTDSDELDIKYAKNVINEFNKSVVIIEKYTNELKADLPADKLDMLTDYINFISTHREIINGCQ